MKVVAIVVVFLALLAATGHIDVTLWTGDSKSATARELQTMFEVEQSSDLDEATAALYKLVDSAPRDRRGATIIRGQLPGLVARFDAAASSLHARTLDVDVTTSLGRHFRGAFLRTVAQQRWLVDALGDEIAVGRPTWRAVRRFNVRSRALGRWWQAQLDAAYSQLHEEEPSSG